MKHYPIILIALLLNLNAIAQTWEVLPDNSYSYTTDKAIIKIYNDTIELQLNTSFNSFSTINNTLNVLQYNTTQEYKPINNKIIILPHIDTNKPVYNRKFKDTQTVNYILNNKGKIGFILNLSNEIPDYGYTYTIKIPCINNN